MFSMSVRIGGPLELRDRYVYAACMFIAEIAKIELLAYPEIPSVMRAGIRWSSSECSEDFCPDDPWLGPLGVISAGTADCKSLVGWRKAELEIRHGLKTDLVIRRATNAFGDVLYHPTLVGWYRGKRLEEDPSAILGMG